jgi:hypothetical protein
MNTFHIQLKSKTSLGSSVTNYSTHDGRSNLLQSNLSCRLLVVETTNTSVGGVTNVGDGLDRTTRRGRAGGHVRQQGRSGMHSYPHFSYVCFSCICASFRLGRKLHAFGLAFWGLWFSKGEVEMTNAFVVEITTIIVLHIFITGFRWSCFVGIL